MMRRLILMAALLALPLPASAQSAPVESRMVIARQISSVMVPEGFLQKVYSAMMPQVIEGSIRNQMGNAKFEQEKNDPNFQERMKRSSKIAADELTIILAPYEGKLREAYATAYAGQFDEGQLAQILAFYSTPTGKAFAQRSLTLLNDPAVVRFQKEIGPTVADAMPGLMEKVKVAIADLPYASPVTKQKETTK